MNRAHTIALELLEAGEGLRGRARGASAAPRKEGTETMTRTKADKSIATVLAVCAAIAVALTASAGQAKAAQPDCGDFEIAKFRIDIEGEQTTTWHRAIDAAGECSTRANSTRRCSASTRSTPRSPRSSAASPR